MGGCCSVAADERFDYDQELLSDKIPRSVEVKLDGKDDLKDVGPVHRFAKFQDQLIDAPFDGKTPEEACTTIWFSFQRGVKKYKDSHCLGMRTPKDSGADEKGRPVIVGDGPFNWKTYNQVDQDVKAIGSGLVGIGATRGATIGICSQNRPEWTMAALGGWSQGLVCVALYDALGADAIEFITNHAETQIIFASKSKLKQVLACLPSCPKLRYIVQFDTNPDYPWSQLSEAVSEGDVKTAAQHNVTLIGFSKLLSEGRTSSAFPSPSEPEDLAFIMYTSGTTGSPKGVMLTHHNIMSCVGGVVRHVFPIEPSDVHISYLPLPHIFESTLQAAFLGFGSSIGFFSGNVKTLIDDIKELQPTIFPGVPRVFSRIHDTLMSSFDKLKWPLRPIILNNLLTQKQNVRRGRPLDAKIEGRMLKVREKMGLKNCRLIVTGAAPCPPYLMEFLRVVINPRNGVLQGYGMTETSAAVTIVGSDDHTLGHVGPPLPSAEIRLRSVPEMNYLITDPQPRGEVLVRGPSIFKGYFKNEEATAESFENGWLSTGDVGRWNPNGTLSIIDRKKNIFKLAHGEYVAAEKIEGLLGRSGLISQLFIYGNSYKPFLLGVVVPSADGLKNFAHSKGWWSTDERIGTEAFIRRFQEVCNAHQDEITQAILDDCNKLANESKLLPYERPKDFVLETAIDELGQGFTVSNDCMTPTFKLRRPFLLRKYEQQLRDLYTKHGERPKDDERW